MRLSRHQIGEKLKNELAKGYDINRISNWAFELEDITLGARDKEVSALLNCLCIIPGGPEYEYTEKELKIICELLLHEEKDPIKIIDKMRIERKAENALDVSEKLMKFPRRYLGEELKYLLERGFDIGRIAHWAYTLWIENRGGEREISDVLDSLSCMASDPGFEYTEEELKRLAELLLNEEKDPMKIVRNMRLESPIDNDPIGQK